MWNSLRSLESTVATLSNKQLFTDCLLSASVLPGKDMDISPFNRTFFEVTHNIFSVSVIFATWTTAKLFKVRVFQLMMFQFRCSTETHWTFITNIWLHTFMTKYMLLKITLEAEFLLTNVTCEPSTFIVWLQQMCLELAVTCTVWTVSTWVGLCTRVSINITLQYMATFKPLPTVTTVIRSSVAVYMTFMSLQDAALAETFVTQWTLVRFVSSVDSHVSG